jgi:xanthine dehydrogenase YagR molybdenum-binding subunit
MPASIIGTPTVRVDGPLKVSGAAPYSADFHFSGLVHLVLVPSPIAKGKILRVDAAGALAMPGVLRVYYHGHAPALASSPTTTTPSPTSPAPPSKTTPSITPDNM